MTTRKKILFASLYLLLFLVLTFSFLLLKFPYRPFIRKEITRFARQYNFLAEYSELEYEFPNHLAFNDFVLKDPAIPAPYNNEVLKLKKLELSAVPFPLKNEVVVTFQASGYSGRLSGQERFNWRDNSHDLEAGFRDLELHDYPLWDRVTLFTSLEGRLEGRLNLRGKSLKDLRGRLELNLKEAVIKGVKAPSLFNELKFTKSSALLSLKGRRLKIDRVSLTGDMFKVEADGVMSLADNPGATPLNMSIKVYPVLFGASINLPLLPRQQREFFKLQLKGTLRRPLITSP